ncbi:molecular chaperone HtpG [Candidatus Sumerlaeota bacterium]|nr:molecular chaperone HtpG [Candidatus Sumerlaeota bacterium]
MSTDTATSVSPETHPFQAEIRQLLDIVIHSLYTDKEIFLRELVSNASDALEKVRHEFLVKTDLRGASDELKINIIVDKDAKVVTIQDNGIGMTRQELTDNIGTIARSGTKQFLSQATSAAKGGDLHLIGQFGVGFYSAFMVAKKVTVETLSLAADAEGCVWESEGTGSYTIAPKAGLSRGTRITLQLKDDAGEFAEEWRIKSIIQKFSNFVPFPIEVDGEKVNTVQAIWTRNKSEVTDEEYNEFYKFLSNDHEGPRYRLHFVAESPISIRALLFVPKDNAERFGMGRQDPGVDLYCRKVMIQKHPENLLPEWMRFVKGLIDSDDLPLNISRETLQDSALIRKLSKVITGRFLKFLSEESQRDPVAFDEFHNTFGRFLKEGAVSDYANRDELVKLLRVETSFTEPGKKTTLTEYVSRMKDGQKGIYYINGPSREAIEAGPYVEALRAREYEVIYNLDQIDDFVFDHLNEFEGKPLLSADKGDLDLPPIDVKEGEELSGEDAGALCGWMKSHFGDRIGTVRASKRLVNNPGLIVTEGHFTATMQRLMAAMKQSGPAETDGKSLTLEINPRHALIRKINDLRVNDEAFAGQLADQLADNAMLAAGLLTDPRAMVERLNKLLSKAAGV